MLSCCPPGIQCCHSTRTSSTMPTSSSSRKEAAGFLSPCRPKRVLHGSRYFYLFVRRHPRIATEHRTQSASTRRLRPRHARILPRKSSTVTCAQRPASPLGIHASPCGISPRSGEVLLQPHIPFTPPLRPASISPPQLPPPGPRKHPGLLALATASALVTFETLPDPNPDPRFPS